jgi:hypothetical protein
MTATLLLLPALAEGPGSSGLGWGVDAPLASLLCALRGARCLTHVFCTCPPSACRMPSLLAVFKFV